MAMINKKHTKNTPNQCGFQTTRLTFGKVYMPKKGGVTKSMVAFRVAATKFFAEERSKSHLFVWAVGDTVTGVTKQSSWIDDNFICAAPLSSDYISPLFLGTDGRTLFRAMLLPANVPAYRADMMFINTRRMVHEHKNSKWLGAKWPEAISSLFFDSGISFSYSHKGKRQVTDTSYVHRIADIAGGPGIDVATSPSVRSASIPSPSKKKLKEAKSVLVTHNCHLTSPQFDILRLIPEVADIMGKTIDHIWSSGHVPNYSYNVGFIIIGDIRNSWPGHDLPERLCKEFSIQCP